MPGGNCAINECLNCKMRNFSKSFFRFPKNKELCKQWIIKVERSDLDVIFNNEGPSKLYRSYFICSDHFSDEDYNNPKNTSQGLKKNRVPSLNLPSNSLTNKKIKVEPDYEATNPNDIIPQDLPTDSFTIEGPCEQPSEISEEVLLLRKKLRQCQKVASKRKIIIQEIEEENSNLRLLLEQNNVIQQSLKKKLRQCQKVASKRKRIIKDKRESNSILKRLLVQSNVIQFSKVS